MKLPIVLTIVLCLSFFFSGVECSFNVVSEVISVLKNAPIHDHLDATRQWLSTMKKSIPLECSKPAAPPDKSKDFFLIKHARCDEPEATKKYSFSGKFDNKNRIKGEGAVIIDDSLPDQKHCIKLGKLFGLKIKSIRSSFVEGLANSTTFVDFFDDNNVDSKAAKAEVIVADGVVRGLFRFETADWWVLSTFVEGQVDGPCWIVHKNFVQVATCFGASARSINSNYPEFFLYHDLTVAVTGKRNGAFFDAQDIHTVNVKNGRFCSRYLSGFTTAHTFKFDLDRLERRYDDLFEETSIDYCKNIDEHSESDEAILKFLKSINKVSPDPTPGMIL